MVILEPLSFSQENVSNLGVGLYWYGSDGSNSNLSPVVHGDILLLYVLFNSQGHTDQFRPLLYPSSCCDELELNSRPRK